MMRGVSTWAVAVRKPLPEQLERGRASTPSEAPTARSRSQSFPLTSVLKRHRLLRLPIVRGVVALGESLVIGFKALGISANAQLPEEEQEISGGMWVGTVVVALAARHRPVLRRAGRPDEPHQGPARLVAAVLARRGRRAHRDLPRLPRCCSRACATCAASSSTTAPSTRRSPATRPACSSRPRTPSASSRLHPRCGTSFLLVVMIVAIFVFAPIGLPAWYLLVLTRIVGVPLIAGISFEIIKFAGRNRRQRWVRAIMWPGPAAAEAHHARARPRRSSPSRSPRWRRCSRSRRRATSPEERVGMEVVA